MGLGVYRCKGCIEAYTQKEAQNLGFKCKKCKKALKEIEPTRDKRYGDVGRISYEQWNAGVERFYFWALEFMKETQFYDVEKITDVYSASEASDFWGTIEQRKAQAADRVSQYLATIGSMTKNLFQLLRELRVIDERLQYYNSIAKGGSGAKGADIALKGIWIDLVEGGAQKPTSVYGMAMQVGFTTLPDFFFDVFIPSKKTTEETLASVSRIIDGLKEMGINRKLREVLIRKLQEYISWREGTKKEIADGRKFKLAYLRQHFHTIRLYLSWAKPYLKNVGSLSMPRAQDDVNRWTELISASEGAVIDLELMGVKPFESSNTGQFKTDNAFKFYFPVVQTKFHYRTQPQMAYRQEWQKGAIHVGRSDIEIRAYALSKNEINKYKQKVAEDDVEILKYLDAAMNALESDFLEYLSEAEDEWAKEKLNKEKKAESPKQASFVAALKEIFLPAKNSVPKKYAREQEMKEAESAAKNDAWVLFKICRKAHGMVTAGD